MKKLFLLTFAFLLMFSLSACDTTSTPSAEGDRIDPDNTTIDDGMSYAGEWELISSSLDGEPLDITANIVNMTADTYSSETSVCAVNGDLIVTDDTMDIFITNHNCPIGPPNDYVMSFSISEDFNTMILVNTQFGGRMVDTFSRVLDDDEDND